MPSVLLADEADRLDNPSLQRGIIETIIDKGARNLTAVLPFDSFTGNSYDYNLEGSEALGSSIESPYGSDIPQNIGEPERIKLDTGMLARNVFTPIINERGKSTFTDQRARDIASAAKRMAKDMVTQHINGSGAGKSLNGFEKFLTDFAGLVDAAGNREIASGTIVTEEEQKVFLTDDGTPGGSAQNLDSEAIRTLLTRSGDEEFDMLWTDEQTYVQIQMIVENMPGNMADHIMSENFGRSVLMIDGTNVMKLDAAGRRKKGANVIVNTTDDTVEVENSAAGDAKFIGFTDLDIGRDFTLYDGDPDDPAVSASAIGSGSVADLDDTSPNWKVSVTWDSEPGSDSATGDEHYVVLDKTPVIYGARYDTMDGATAFYHNTDGAPANPGEQYTGPIAGFNASDLGRARAGNRRARETQLDWFGNFAVKSPYAVARLSHFSYA